MGIQKSDVVEDEEKLSADTNTNIIAINILNINRPSPILTGRISRNRDRDSKGTLRWSGKGRAEKK